VEGRDERSSSPEETEDRRRQQDLTPAAYAHSLPVFREGSASGRGSLGAEFFSVVGLGHMRGLPRRSPMQPKTVQPLDSGETVSPGSKEWVHRRVASTLTLRRPLT
jgi:hypothetical protein